jgi:hypothetical protein
MLTSNYDIGRFVKVYEDIEELIKLTKQKYNFIIMGDWKSLIGYGSDEKKLKIRN